jgi:phenylacetic acid degradation operon negative regulatory protein
LKPKTEEFLYLLLWATNMALRPTFRNLTDSFEAWAYRNDLRRQLAILEKRRLLESEQLSDGQRLHRLTEAGRRLALGPRDPVSRWKRRWDGKWRMVVFDVPQRRAGERIRLRRSLADRGFGYLQDSVWITPDPLKGERSVLSTAPVDVETLILLEARPCAGESDAQIVAGAWDFEAINAGYALHRQVLDRWPHRFPFSEADATRLQQWCCEERQAWNAAISFDPLLPERLLPADYHGREAWKRRAEVMGRVGRNIRAFQGTVG